MSVRRIIVLFHHEIKSSLKSFFFFQAVLTPLLFSLVLSLVFGRFFLGTPELGFLKSELTDMVGFMDDSINISFYESESELLAMVEKNVLDMAIVLPESFDRLIRSDEKSEMTIYFNGNTPLLKRTELTNAFSRAIKEMSGRTFPVKLKPLYSNDIKAKPWFDRMMPLLVILAIMMSGMLLPSTSLVSEKQNGTLQALLVSPVSYRELQFTKTYYACILSMIMGIAILLINRALPEQWGPFLLVLFLGSLCASTLGSLFGYAGNSILSVINLIKSLMMVFYAPAILNFFTVVPQWVQKVFPTYYIYGPLIKISHKRFSFAEDGWEILVLLVIVFLLQLWLFKLVNRETRKII
ncbi:MAG: ABC transporter permease [Spirochaetaceae bacterium]|nr:ABC transporter permease [Spirochaetaceae bacterium]